jgi:cobaltochelatase CobN
MFMSHRTIDEWKSSVQGSTASEVLISVMLPEFDGAIETFPIGAKGEPIINRKFEVTLNELEIIPERLERLAETAKKHINLSKKPASEKKIAIICYNYPPGEGNLFGGAFLDTFKSVENILSKLKASGYDNDALSAEALMGEFCAGKLVNSGRYSDECPEMIRYPLKKYKEYYETLPECALIEETWGNPGGSIMTDEKGEFLIPALTCGNVLIGLQPSRGLHEEQDKLYHDKTLPPHHQYLAFYKYLRDEFKADAVIHVGTHGTLEFLKGKECSMSGDCYPDMLIGSMPHLYLYYCGNPSEAMIAKRRSHAQIISYQPPVFVPGRLYGDYAALNALLDDYHHALSLSPASARNVMENIRKAAVSLNLPENLEEIEAELYRMNMSLIPSGLHIIGKGYTDNEALEYTKGLLRYSRNGVDSLRLLAAREKGDDIEAFEEAGNFKKIQEYEEKAEAVFRAYFEHGKFPEENPEHYKATLEYGADIYEKVVQNRELEALIHALSGGYTPAKQAGDIYRNPDVLPTGTNLFQFDQRLVPARTAFERGVRIAENTIKTYKSENGAYPDSAAVILWGLETSRTQGETFSQILGYLGVRLDKKSSLWEPKFEIIPIEELGRPRIDVTANICGFFRDMFPNLINNLDDILHLLFEADENDEQNYFKAHSKKIYERLLNEGYDEQEAKKLCVSRIFGPKEGEYGTGITTIIETKAWETEGQIGSQFLTSLKYVYNRSSHGEEIKGLYETNLKSVDIVSQIRDNQEYEITDLDHYFEFFGGLSKSVEMVRGKKAAMYITDTTGDRVITETVDKSINRGIRTRVLNPKWIDGMLSSKYHGTQKIAERFENVMGLSATTGSVEQWIYNDLQKVYVEDESMRKRLAENNPHAYMSILEQMMEYYKRGYWNATEEQLAEIKKAFLELEDRIEESL